MVKELENFLGKDIVLQVSVGTIYGKLTVIHYNQNGDVTSIELSSSGSLYWIPISQSNISYIYCAVKEEVNA